MTKSRNNVDSDEVSISLLSLPEEMDRVIVNQAAVGNHDKETKIMATLSITCKHFGFFQLSLNKRAGKQLAQYIGVEPDVVKAEAIVKANPGLLLLPVGEVVNPHTNQITKDVKPLQLAYSEDDNKIYLMLKSYFELACGSAEAARKEIQQQLNERFGKGSDKLTESKEVRMERLTALIEAISNEQFNNGRTNITHGKWILNEATQIAIEKFRNTFVASQPKIIHSGKRFHLDILDDMCEGYAKAASQWNFNFMKCALLEDVAMSLVLCYVPINDALRFNKDLYYFTDDGKELKQYRTTRDEHHFYQLLLSTSADFLLSGSCVDIVYGGVARADRRYASFGSVNRIKSLCYDKCWQWEDWVTFMNLHQQIINVKKCIT